MGLVEPPVVTSMNLRPNTCLDRADEPVGGFPIQNPPSRAHDGALGIGTPRIRTAGGDRRLRAGRRGDA